jgi:hypothetical protein
MTGLREQLREAMLAHETTIHPGAPRSVSDFHAHIEVDAAVEIAAELLAEAVNRTRKVGPMIYRKKPVEVAAVRFDGENGPSLAEWCGGRWRTEVKPSYRSDIAQWVDIPTLEGVMRASVGDWIIRGVHGEFYPCKPDIFAATYDPVTIDTPPGGGGVWGDGAVVRST